MALEENPSPSAPARQRELTHDPDFGFRPRSYGTLVSKVWKVGKIANKRETKIHRRERKINSKPPLQEAKPIDQWTAFGRMNAAVRFEVRLR